MPGTVTRRKALGLVKSAPPEEGKAKLYTFKLSDGEFDRYNDRLSVTGWKLDGFNANPVIFYNHESGTSWMDDRKSLPIGKGRAYQSGPDLLVDIEFDQGDEFARKVESKVDGGFLNAVSVGYRMSKYHENDRGGYDSEEHELLEASIVSIPGNDRALRVRSFSDDPEFLDQLAAALARHQKVAPPVPPLTSQGIKMTPEEIKAAIEAASKAAAAATASAVSVEHQKQIAELQATHQKQIDAEQAKVVEAAKGNRDGGNPVLAPEATRSVQVGGAVILKTPGQLAAKFIQAKALAEMERRPLGDVLKAQGDEILMKALQQSTFTGFGSTVHESISGDFIEMLRNVSAVRASGPQQISLKGGSLKFDRQTGAASASYGAEGTAINAGTDPATDQLVLSEKKLTGLIPISNDLIRNSSIGAQEMIRADLQKVMALTEDSAFLFGLGTANTPRGLYFQIAAAHRKAMLALTTAGTPTVGEAKKEFNRLLKLLEKANVDMSRFGWLFNPDVKGAVLDAVGPGGEGSNSLEREMLERSTVRGKAFQVTNQIPNTLTSTASTGGTKTAIMGFDWSDVIIADWMALELDVFVNGSYNNAAGTVVSGISSDQTVIRAISKHDIGMRRTVSGVAAYDVTWGI